MPRKPITSPTGKPIRLAPIRPNLGVERAYQRRIDALVEQMQRDVIRTIKATWNRKPPKIAQDESSPAALRDAMERLGREWESRFDDFAQSAGRRFAGEATGSADRAFADALRKAGFTVKFQISRNVQEIFASTVQSQVALIRNIPAETLTQIEGHVMRSVQAGRDLGSLAKAMEEQFGVTKRRAATIARSQNNIATATITKERQRELGITHATWLHSAGGKHPRPEHVAFSGKSYEIAKGAFLEEKWTWPGVEINCRCVSRSIIPGITDI
jgi:SPP1 gp7 family putative phage head morphogenesis protein